MSVISSPSGNPKDAALCSVRLDSQRYLTPVSSVGFGSERVSRCEYCQLPAALYPAPFQIDHIIAWQHGGATRLENLALACILCNRFKFKVPNIAGLNPDSGEIVRLFHSRRDSWA